MDRDLVQRAQHGDREAFASLVRTHGDRLFGVARRILRDFDLADDAVQQALVTCWRQLPHLREAERFEAWSVRILVRICYELSRTSRRAALNVVTIDSLDELPTGDSTDPVVHRDELERAFRRLPSDRRAILVLRHYLGMDPAEIATLLGIPAGTARSRLHYAHREMRAALEADARRAPAGGRSA